MSWKFWKDPDHWWNDRETWKNIGASCIVVVLMMAIALLISSCRTHKDVTHSSQKDSTTTFSPGEVDIPEKNTNFEVDFGEICEELIKANSNLKEKYSELKQQLLNAPDTVYIKSQTKNGTTLTTKVNRSGKGTVGCNEDAYKKTIDSLYKAISVKQTEKIIQTETVYPWDYNIYKVGSYVLLVLLAISGVLLWAKYKRKNVW